MIRANYSDNLIKIAEAKLSTGNIYKIIKTKTRDEYVMGCGEGLFFVRDSDLKFTLSEERIFFGKYVT